MNVAMVPSCTGLRLFKNCNNKIKIIMYNNISLLIDGHLSMCTEDKIMQHIREHYCMSMVQHQI